MESHNVFLNRALVVEFFVTEMAFETFQLMDRSNVFKQMTYIFVLLKALYTVIANLGNSVNMPQ